MPGDVHEIRDPIHVFVRLDSDERRVLDSAPFQRLRHIHQLALTLSGVPGGYAQEIRTLAWRHGAR